MLESLLGALRVRRMPTLLASLVLLLVALALLPRLGLNDAPERWMPAASVQAWQHFNEHFEVGDTLAVGIEFHRAVRDDDLDFLRRLRTDLQQAGPGIKRVYDVSIVIDRVEQVPLTELIAPPTADSNDPYALYRGALFDDPKRHRGSGRTLVDFVELHTDVQAGARDLQDQRRQTVAEVYRVLEKHRRDDVTFHTVGGIVIQYELERIARHVAATFLPLSVLLGLVALGVGFRSRGALGVAVLGGVWSIVLMLGAVALAGWSLDVVTVGGPTLMAVIVVATTVHFAHHHAHGAEASLQPSDGGAASGRISGQGDEGFRVVRWVGVPCLGAGVTTGVGFLMLTFNELAPIRELGFELFIGSLLAFFGVFLAWIALGTIRGAPPRVLTARRLGWIEQISNRWPGRVIAVLVLAMVVALVGSTRVRIDADPFAFFHPESRIAVALRHFAERGFGLYSLDVALVPRDGRLDSEDRLAVQDFIRTIEQHPEADVRKVISSLQFFDHEQSLRLADVRRALLFFELFTGWARDLQDSGAVRVTFMAEETGSGFGPLVEAVLAALPTDRFDCISTGAVAQVVLLSEGLVGGIAKGLAVALVVMAVVCTVLFQSVRLAAIAFLPNAFPIVAVFGLMGVFGLPLNSGSAMVATISLGIALNDTVHFLLHYRREIQEGYGTDQAVSRTFQAIGRPLVLTSAINAAGFSIFLLSEFRPLYHFGLLSGVAMAAALVGDLLLLPALLRVVEVARAGKALVGTGPYASRASAAGARRP